MFDVVRAKLLYDGIKVQLFPQTVTLKVVMQSFLEFIIKNVEARHSLVIGDLRAIVLQDSNASFLEPPYSFLQCLLDGGIKVLLKVLPRYSECYSIKRRHLVMNSFSDPMID